MLARVGVRRLGRAPRVLCSWSQHGPRCQPFSEASQGAFKYRELVGVLGGLGPEASAMFAQIMVEECQRMGAKKDDEHVPMLMYVNPVIPSARSAAIGQGPSPQNGIAESFRRMKAAGATQVCVACNTAHAFARQAAADAGTPFLDMLELTALAGLRQLESNAKPSTDGIYRVGLLGTDGTIQMNIYQDAFAAAAKQLFGSECKVECLVAQDLSITQECVLRVKAGTHHHSDVPDVLAKEATALVDRGAQLIVTGCTELPICFNTDSHPAFPTPIMNPMKVLAAEIVQLTKASELPICFNTDSHPAFPTPIMNPMTVLAAEIVQLTKASSVA